MSFLKELGLFTAGSFLWELMLSFTFFIGIFLVVSREAVECLNRDFQRELGWRKYVITQIETKKFMFIDAFILKYPIWVGLLIAITSFVLLLVRRM